MTTTEYLERRAFRAGWNRGRYSALADSLCSKTINSLMQGGFLDTPGCDIQDEDWKKYSTQPIQFELDLKEAPDEQNDRL